MPLTVLQVAYPLAPVGPDEVGGAEQVLTALDEALERRGHRSVVIAAEGSVCRGILVPTPLPAGPLDDVAREQAWRAHRLAIQEALERWPASVVHMHGLDFHRYLPPPGPPVLATLHLPPDWYSPEVFRLERPGIHLHCVSASQRRRCPPGARLLEEVNNGVSLDVLQPGTEKERFVLALGRICEEKGFHLALAAARKVGVPMLLAGRVFGYPEHLRYFEQSVRPLLDGERRFIGPAGLEQKRRLLAAARCLLIPSLVPETSSLVAMEALACGTPVIAFPAGALADIIEHGRTGFLVRNVEEMAEAIAQVEMLRSEDCRRAAEERFDSEVMVGRYLTLYERLARTEARGGGGRLQIQELASIEELEALQEEWRALCERCPWTSPFQRPEWLVPWARHLGSGQLWGIQIREGARLVGLCLLELDDGTGERRVLRLLGTGVSDYLDALFEPELCARGMEALLGHLWDQRARWDTCDFEQLRPGSPLLDAPLAPGLEGEAQAQESSPVLTLPPEATLRTLLDARMRASLRQARSRAAKLGVELESVTPSSMEELLAGLFRLHRARWQTRGQAGVLASGALEHFHREVAAGFLRAGKLRLYGVRLGGQLAGVFYGFADGRCVYCYLGGFDPAFERASPGTLLIAHAVEEAMRAGAEEVDFLRGSEPYKYNWGAKDRPSWRRRVWRVGYR